MKINKVFAVILIINYFSCSCQFVSDSIHFSTLPKQSNKFKNVLLIIADDLG